MPDVIFNGPAGRIEGRYHHVASKDAPMALILHPHPQHGGTMNNKVVYTLYHLFARRGFSTLRFNFRGVGRSQGTFDRGEGELMDAASALDWMMEHNPDSPYVYIAGFSFGAWIGMQLLMRRPEIAGFVMVAPPANMYDFTFLAPCPSSGLFIVGEKDEISPPQSVETLAKRLQHQRDIEVDYVEIPGADHFFKGTREPMAGAIDSYLDVALNNLPEHKILNRPKRRMTSGDQTT